MRRTWVLRLFSERRPAFDCVSPYVRSCLALRSLVPRPAFADKYRERIKKSAVEGCRYALFSSASRLHSHKNFLWRLISRCPKSR